MPELKIEDLRADLEVRCECTAVYFVSLSLLGFAELRGRRRLLDGLLMSNGILRK